MSALLFVSGFLLLVVLGVPIAYALIAPSILYAFYFGLPAQTVAHTLSYALDSYPLLAIPIFVLVGSLMNSSGIGRRLFTFAQLCVAHWKGGLVQVNILASLILAGATGSALANIGGLGSMKIKAMFDVGYTKPFAAAVTAASATIGPIFPPSIPLIIFAATAQTSAAKLLLAGIVPALIITIALMMLTTFLARYRNYPAHEKAKGSELWRSFIKALPALLTPLLLCGGIMSGVFTATESAAVTVLYILFIGVFIYRDFRWQFLVEATIESVRITVVLMIMVAASILFTRIMTIEQIPQAITSALLMISTDPIILLLIVNVILLLLGMLLETNSAILVVTPLIVPPLVMAGVDPTHIGIVVVYNLMIGLLTPPMGMSLFLVSNISQTNIWTVMREVLPYYVPLFAVLIILTYVPQLSTWLPSLFFV